MAVQFDAAGAARMLMLVACRFPALACCLTSYAAGDDNFAMLAALQQGVCSAHGVEHAVHVGGEDVAPVVLGCVLWKLHADTQQQCNVRRSVSCDIVGHLPVQLSTSATADAGELLLLLQQRDMEVCKQQADEGSCMEIHTTAALSTP